jgi:hypothetical protein
VLSLSRVLGCLGTEVCLEPCAVSLWGSVLSVWSKVLSRSRAHFAVWLALSYPQCGLLRVLDSLSALDSVLASACAVSASLDVQFGSECSACVVLSESVSLVMLSASVSLVMLSARCVHCVGGVWPDFDFLRGDIFALPCACTLMAVEYCGGCRVYECRPHIIRSPRGHKTAR